MKDGGYYVLGEKSEEFQVLNLERKCAMSVYLSTVWVSGGVSVSSLIYLMILLVYCRANLASTHVPMIWQKQLLTDILNMLLCQIDYQNNNSQSIFSFKFPTFVSCWRKVCVNVKAALFFHIVTENMLFHHIRYFIY